jgi:hypothetical protein
LRFSAVNIFFPHDWQTQGSHCWAIQMLLLLNPLTLLLAADAAGSFSMWTALAWIGGLVCGALLMASLTTDWQRLPAYLRLWGRALRSQLGWAILGVGSLGVLVFY